MRLSSDLHSRGITLIEIMVGMIVMTVGLLGLSTAFNVIGKSVLVNKNNTLAVNLAQEKIEALKDLSYYRLLVTTSVTTSDPNFPSNAMYYDNSYYPEESLNVGGTSFKRRCFVEFLAEDGNEFVGYPTITHYGNDTGIKRITVYVVWEEDNDWKIVELKNLRNNPNRAELEYSFTGIVSSGSTGIPIYNALVDTEQNPSYYDRTDATGRFSFKVQPGTYTLRAAATGYFTAISTAFHVPANVTGSYTKNFSLSKKMPGISTGTVYLRNHLVITQVVAGYDSGGQMGQEWVELYNPSTYSVLIASKTSASGTYDRFFVKAAWIDNSNNEPGTGGSKYLLADPSEAGSAFTAFRSTSLYWDTGYSSRAVFVPPQSFFLISNYSTITINGSFTRIADAYYEDGDGGNQMDSQGGIRVAGAMGHDYNGRSDWHDGFGWGGGAISKAYEGVVNGNSMGPSHIFYRQAIQHKLGDCFTAHTQQVRIQSPHFANNFDNNLSGSNCGSGGGSNFDHDSVGANYLTAGNEEWGINNADTVMAPYTGQPAVGASVYSNDGLSPTAYVQSYGSFTLTDIATGTWTLTVSTGYFTRELSTFTITPHLSTSIPSGVTIPKWEYPEARLNSLALTTTTLYGYISGTVRDALQRPLAGATVDVSGAASQSTNSEGRYRAALEPTSYIVMVSAGKTGYSTESQNILGISLGMEESGVDFTLVNAGRIKGFVSTNGLASGALPGIPIVATDLSSSTTFGSTVSGSDGLFYIESVATGTYLVSPQLESGETASPGIMERVVTVAPQVGWSTFTVSNAFGEITGSVSRAGSAIETGTLIFASTSPINTGNPPDITAGVRSGSVLYYAASSDSAGRYSLPVRGGQIYYLYGWSTTNVGVDTSSTTKVSAAANPIAVSGGGTVTENLSW